MQVASLVAAGVGAAAALLARRALRRSGATPLRLRGGGDDDWAAARSHDAFNLVASGALNVLQAAWWSGLVDGEAALRTIFAADVAYIAIDAGWRWLQPSCVAARVWSGLFVHHVLVLACASPAWSEPLFMRHLLRTWIVEIQSWMHIATRQLGGRCGKAAAAANKPLFVALRLVGFPLTYFAYAAERRAVPERAPLYVHVPLSIAHFALWALMLHWGKRLLLAPPKEKDG